MNPVIEAMARAIDPHAFADWTTPPRGLEMSSTAELNTRKTWLMKRARKQAQAALCAGLRSAMGENAGKAWDCLHRAAYSDATAGHNTPSQTHAIAGETACPDCDRTLDAHERDTRACKSCGWPHDDGN